MKRYAACFAMLGLCAGLFAADLVKNGDFETDADWVSDSPKEKPGFSYLEEGAFSGKRCMKVDLYAYQGVRLEKGKSYKLTVSVKCKDVPQDGFCVKILKFENGKPVGWVQEQGVYQLVRSGGTHDWKTLTRVIPARMIGDGVSGCLFVANEKKAGEVFVDDLSLELLPDEGAENAADKAEEKKEPVAGLIRNGGFEAEASWDSPKTDPPAFIYDASSAHTGERSLKINAHAYQSVSLQKDKAYKLTVFVKCKDVPQDGFCVKILKFENGKPSGWINNAGVYQLVRTGGTHDWKELTATLTPAMIGEGAKGFLFVSREKKEGEVWADDISLTEVPVPEVTYRESPNLWPYDGSFETGTDLFSAKRDSSTAHDGKYSLRIEPGTKLASFRAFLLKKANRTGCLSFYIKADRPCSIDVYTHDDWWSWNGQQSFRVGKEWTRCIVYQKKQPTTSSVSFTVAPKDPEAVLWLDSLSYTLDFPAPGYTPARPFDVGSSMPESGGLLPVSKEPVVHTVSARNNTGKPGTFLLRAELENASVPGAATLFEKSVTLKEGELFETETTVLPEARRGYYVLRTTLLQEGETAASHAQPFAVVDPPPEIQENSIFGIHFENGSQTRKLGVSWTRNFRNWYETPGKDGAYHLSGDDVVARSKKIHQFWCINTHAAPGSVKVNGRIPDEALLAWVKAVLASYQGTVPAVEFMNEPDLAFPKNPEAYAEQLNKLIPEARKVAPGVKFGGSAVSGVDFNQDFRYTEKVLAIAGKNLDIVAVHPYSYNHYVDSADTDNGPESAKTYERGIKLRNLLEKYGSKAEVWYGEVGWAPDVTDDYLSEANRRAASYIPRLFVLSKAAGVKKVFYFLIETCLERERYNYGIFRSNKPLPGTSVYAAAVQAIEFSELSKAIANQDYHAFTFKRADGKMLACLWMSNREKVKITLKLPEGGEVRDMFWNPVALENNAWRLSGEMSYVLVPGMDEEAFNRMIAAAEVEMPPLKAVWKLAGGKAVDLTLCNLRAVPQKGTVTLTGAKFGSDTREVDLAAGGTQVLRFASEEFLSGKTVQLAARTNFGDFSASFRPVIMDCPSWTRQEFLADALPETGRLPVMDSRNFLLPNDPTNGWDGPQNLSVKSAVGHDEENLYLRIDVTDDVHHQNRKPGMLWAGDSIQLAIDSKGNASGMGYDKDDYEFGFGLTPNGAEKELTYTHDAGRAPSILDGAEVDIRRTDDVTRYRIRIPWSVLKIEPEPGTVFGMNFTANDSDGAAVRFWMGITPGIVDSKNPGAYRKFLIR